MTPVFKRNAMNFGRIMGNLSCILFSHCSLIRSIEDEMSARFGAQMLHVFFKCLPSRACIRPGEANGIDHESIYS